MFAIQITAGILTIASIGVLAGVLVAWANPAGEELSQ
jgi:hypothetical protein